MRLLLIAGLLLANAWASTPVAGQVPVEIELQELMLYEVDQGVRLEIKLEQPVQASHFALKLPDRIVIDLPQVVRKKLVKLDIPYPAQKWIRGLRLGTHKKHLRLVLDLTKPVDYSFNADGASWYLDIDLPRAQTEQGLQDTANSGPAKRDLVVLIDAGHGGKDPGAISRRGLQEKEVALQIAAHLYHLLLPLEGFQPHMTRSQDYYLKLRERREHAQKIKADVFISVHADSARSSRARGGSVYTLSLAGASSEAARQLAKRENEADNEVLKVGEIALEGDKSFDTTIVDLAQSSTIERSQYLAKAIINQLRQVSYVRSLTPGRANFAVLRMPYIPSVLVEAGYLSNNKDAASLSNVRFRRRIARAILGGLHHYVHSNPYPGTIRSQSSRFLTYRVKQGDQLLRIATDYGVTQSSIMKSNGIPQDAENDLQPGQLLRIPVRPDRVRK
ncbi:MAG: N-acetylmuramoyl-L-alanine amidase [Gammaproteobacteria bacterium]